MPITGGPIASRDAVEGAVLMIDHYGNLITNVPGRLVDDLASAAGEVRVRIGSAFIDGLVRTFGDVDEGRALAYIGSGEHLEIAVNGGRASDLLHLGIGDPIRVERTT
jgi:S-adenosylmethionine hydrolase